jgi:hypothetical protein
MIENAVFLFMMVALGCALLGLAAIMFVTAYTEWRNR